jgi:hypothetical protein
LETQEVTAKTLAEVLLDLESSVKGLRLEVKGYRTHMGSSTEFMLIEIERLISVLQELRTLIK